MPEEKLLDWFSGKKAVVTYEDSESKKIEKMKVPLAWTQDHEKLKVLFWPNKVIQVWEQA